MIRSILEDSKGNFWFGSDLEGVCRYDGKSFTYFTMEDGLAHNQVRTIQEDLNGNIWFATGRGVSSYDGIKMATHTTEDVVLNMNVTGPKWEGKSTDLHFNSEARSVYRFDGKNFEELAFPTSVQADDRFRHSGTTTSISRGGDGMLWIASYGGVVGFDGSAFKMINDSTFQYHVRSTLVDSKGNLWIGNNGIGVLCYDGDTTTRLSDREELSLTPQDQFPYHVFALEEDKSGNIWIGDRDTGAWRFDGKTLTHYTSKDGLANNFVRVIYKDKKGELWFGQEHGGVTKFNGVSFNKAF